MVVVVVVVVMVMMMIMILVLIILTTTTTTTTTIAIYGLIMYLFVNPICGGAKMCHYRCCGICLPRPLPLPPPLQGYSGSSSVIGDNMCNSHRAGKCSVV